jgi:hypothetical protein
MTGRRVAALGVAGAMLAGAAWFGVATAAAGGDDSRSAGGWSDRTVAVHSLAQGQRLAARAGLTGRTLTIVARTVREAGVNEPPAGQSPGDFFIFEQRLYNASRNVIGRDTVRCENGIRSFTCEATARLNGRGTLRVAGSLFPGDRFFRVPVTGGTQKFDDVGGELMVFDLRGGDDLLVFELRHLRP